MPPRVQQPISHLPQSSQIAGHCMVVLELLQNVVQPSADLAHPSVKTSTQLLLDLCELGMHPLGLRHAPELEPALTACDGFWRNGGHSLDR